MDDLLLDENESTPRYVIGIDLGTTNVAVAYVDLQAGERPAAHIFAVPQLIAPGELGLRSMLPSFLYLPGAHELPPGAAALPWDEQRQYLVGQAALEQGARVPGRLVASAKSWLSYAAVDRTAPILPWGAAGDVAKVSPLEASRRYLEHIREAWDATIANGSDEGSFARQAIVLTVPASFDEVARELTMQAAEAAGIGHAVLLEEPLAAFYAWLADHEADWQQQLREGQLLLVCDIGGGTSDFTLVGVRRGEAGLRFDRLAVGEHLMLGGDNMDITLARFMETQLLGQPGKLDPQRWQQLVYACRRAKETLLGDNAPAAVEVAVLGTSGRVIGGTLAGRLRRDDVLRLLIDGFFPPAPLDSVPQTRRAGLAELGLPYVADPAITHHLAAFWNRFQRLLREESGRAAPYPDWLLFNGGTLLPRPIRARLAATVQGWFAPIAGAAWQPGELPNPQPELAVALGAAYYGVVRQGQGVRVGSGSPRAFYVAVDTGTAQQATAHAAVCLVPRGTEEGFQTQLDEPAFVARTNQPVAFELWTSSTRLGDKLGDVVQLEPDEVTALPPIRSVLRYGRGVVNTIPVRLEVRLSEVGTLELWCRAIESEHRWRLQFDLRREAAVGQALPDERDIVDEAAIEQAQARIRSTFSKAAPADHTPATLRSSLEQILGLARPRWPTQTIRRLAQTLFECQAGRARSPEHETRWLNLLGFCLRPGYGDISDEVHMQQAWKLYLQGLRFPKEPQCRSEWWVLWRRIAGGLSSGRQQHIYAQVWPYLDGGKAGKQKPNPMFPKSLRPGEDLEIWMMLASFEWLAAPAKTDIGNRLLARAAKRALAARELWALGRLGNRTALYGALDRLVPAGQAESWLQTLLAMQLPPTENLGYCLVLLAQYTGDRARDVSAAIRERVAQALRELPNTERLTQWLSDPERHLERSEQSWMLGEELPSGLQLQTAVAPMPDGRYVSR